ncbi:MAG: thioredoxin [Hyphomicrobiales bacterium]|nr:thioredoxin [Hyphomicrobiales bacterium]
MAGQDVKIVTDASFKSEVLDSAEPVLVDFFAEWCGPCKAMAPAIDQVASEMKGKVKIAKIDVDENPAITQQYRIQAMPTLMIFKGGKVAAQHVGAMVQKKKLEDWIKSSI